MPAVPGPRRTSRERPAPSGGGHFAPAAPAASHYCAGGPFVRPSGLGVPSVSHFLLLCSEKPCHSGKPDLTFLQEELLGLLVQKKGRDPFFYVYKAINWTFYKISLH